MTDSSLCMNLVSIHWKLANLLAEPHKGPKVAPGCFIQVAEPGEKSTTFWVDDIVSGQAAV